MKTLIVGLFAVSALSACAGVTAEAPLTVPLGLTRDNATRALHEHQYCPLNNDPPARESTFPRCDRTGTEWGDSWVTAHWDGDTLVELRRWERFVDDTHALARWNQLIADRAKQTPESPEADDALRVQGPLQPGTRAVKAFRVDDRTLVGVYLLTPSPPENATVLEKVVVGPRAATHPASPAH